MTEKKQLNYDTAWQEKYKDMIATPAAAIKKVQPGKRIFVGTGCAQPALLTEALCERSGELPNTEIVHLLTLGEAPYADKHLANLFRVNSFFIAKNVREVIQEGLGDYTPIFLSDIPNLFSSGRLPLDVALFQVTPPNEHGLCSLGVSVDIVKSAVENASLVIAQVNPRMPRTMGDSCIYAHDIDVMVPCEESIIEVGLPEIDEATREIGEHVASLIDNGSTIEFGIGRIPQAVTEFLNNKKDLGIHTEMFTDSIIDLVESGVVTGKRKSINQGKIVASFCMGSQALYDYIDGNPRFDFHPTEYVNDPFVISRHNKMVAINVALEIDLTGQVCADSLGTKFYSGIGGQVDFNRGAARSRGGKAIIALPSTAQNNTISRIVPCLSEGAGVVTTRGDVHYVVTEYGVAYLHGKSVQERAIALISIAHPAFRERLLKQAIKSRYVRPEMTNAEGKIHIMPPELKTSHLLRNATQVDFRPVHATDVPRMKDLFHALSKQTLFYRFLSRAKSFSHKEIQNFVYIDHRNEIAIVGTVPEAQGEEIVAIGRYYLDVRTNRAEVAFTVRDAWQNQGIGSFLFQTLMNIAKRNGIGGFTAEVLRENKPMQAVLNKANCSLTSELNEGVISYLLDFA